MKVSIIIQVLGGSVVRKNYVDLKKVLNSNLISVSENTGTRVYDYDDNNVVKLFEPIYTALCMMNGIDIKGKILEVDNLDKEKIKEIVLPKYISYDKERTKRFVGYTMPKIYGVDYSFYSANNPLAYDLNYYADMHSKFEDIVRRGNEQGIIFPDLCTCRNIIITPSGEVRFIDYDDFQVRNIKTNCHSSAFGDNNTMISLGIIDEDGLFNDNADKMSLIILYFLDALNINLSKYNSIDAQNGKRTSIEEALWLIGLDDPDIQHKVWKIFQKNEQNEFLGDDLYRMAEMYTIERYISGNKVLRKLRRK